MDITRPCAASVSFQVTTSGSLIRLTMADNPDGHRRVGDRMPKPSGRNDGNFSVHLHAAGIMDIFRPDLLRTVN